MEGRPALHGARGLTPAWEIAYDPPDMIGGMVTALIRDFLEKGGDFSQPTEIRFETRVVETADGESERLFAFLRGWGTSRSSTSATSASSDS